MAEGSHIRWKVFAIRLILSLFFSYFLIHFFIPRAGVTGWVVMAILLMFFSYVFESAHGRTSETKTNRGEYK